MFFFKSEITTCQFATLQGEIRDVNSIQTTSMPILVIYYTTTSTKLPVTETNSGLDHH